MASPYDDPTVQAYLKSQQDQVTAYLQAQQAAAVKAYWDSQYALAHPAAPAPAPTTVTQVQQPAGPATPPLPTGPTAPTTTTPPADDGSNALQMLETMYPWAKQLGLDQVIRDYGTQGLDTDQIYAALQQTDQYKYQTQGMYKADGTKRFSSESAFFAWRDQTSQILKNYGAPGNDYNDPTDYVGLAESEMTDPSELEKRLQTYNSIKASSDDVKAAFYVYAGRTLTDDELYTATVDPQAAVDLTSDYNQKVALSPLDYDTWITRATQFATSATVDKLTNLKAQGVDTGDAIDQIKAMDPDFAKQLATSLFQSTSTDMGLDAFTQAYNAALIGGAAKMNGVEVPTEDRVKQFAQAGVDRAKALSAYAEIGSKGQLYAGEAQRAGFNIDTSGLEDAFLLQSGPSLDIVKRADAGEKAGGMSGGKATIGQDNKTGKVQQLGLQGQQT